jgi:hypothetical protein
VEKNEGKDYHKVIIRRIYIAEVVGSNPTRFHFFLLYNYGIVLRLILTSVGQKASQCQCRILLFVRHTLSTVKDKIGELKPGGRKNLITITREPMLLKAGKYTLTLSLGAFCASTIFETSDKP